MEDVLSYLNYGLMALSVFSLSMTSAHAAPASAESEVALVQATIDYQAKNFTKVKEQVRKLLKADPDNAPALELLALSHRQLKEDQSAAATYEKLLKIGAPAKIPAYSFELATIRYKDKKVAEAKKLFNVAATANFNAGTSHFFLGVMEFNAKSWRTARHHLTASLTYNDGKPMEPVTRFYLANTYAQLGKNDQAILNYHTAEKVVELREKDKGQGADQMAIGIKKNAIKELKALDKSSKYVSLTLMQQFDSNVQTNPSEVENAVAASSQRSGKSVLSASGGYSTSPTRDFQISPSFNFFTNYNYHWLARDFNFMSYTPAMLIAYKPYSRLSTAIKTEGIFSMKNNLDPDQSRQDLKYRPFSLTANVGPVVKYELTPRISLAAESYWRPKRFYLDPATGDSRRSGGGVFGRLSSEFVSGYAWWNPTAYISFEWDHPSGKTFRAYTWGGGLGDSWAMTEKLTMNLNFDMFMADYYQGLPKRDDSQLAFRLAGSYGINEHWTAVADASYTVNDSSISTSFKYNRFVTSAGATYTF